jgi:hypothetical protein
MMTVMAATLVMAVAGPGVLADNRYSEREIFDLANRNGYQYGVREGRYDRREGNRHEPKKNRAYKDGKYGYRDDYRHDGTYRDGFRRGFLDGYEDGYNGRSSRRRDDDYDYRRNRRNDDDYDNRRNRRDDDDYDNRRGRDNGRRNGRPWWDILTGQDGAIYDDRGNRRRP